MNLRLPIEDTLPALLAALKGNGVAVLQAPPGAGKTTGVPPALLASGIVDGKIVMLEPRRLAARAAAERIASTLGEPLGRTVGYRIRGETKVSRATRIEVVTEGILTAMLQRDPELFGVGAILFDEFHERSLHADLGLALVWETRDAFRPDLKVLVMSATLDAQPVAALLGDAPVVTSEGRSYPVETHWLDRPLSVTARFEHEVSRLTIRAMEATEGGVLVFLPGAREIARVASQLSTSLPRDTALHQLFGNADARSQRAAISPEKSRKIVLATSIAETSLTIPGIRSVVDGGLSRRARFDPARGMSCLVTQRTSKAEADQRRGRAGREAPGTCFRLWAKAEEGGMAPFAPPEIELADLSGLALELSAWGADPAELAFLTPPPEGPLRRARDLLYQLGAVTADNRITEHGRDLVGLPLHPRLAHMLLSAGRSAADLAALLAEGDPLPHGAPVDLKLRLDALKGDRSYGPNPARISRIRSEAKRLAKLAPEKESLHVGAMAALAYPDRIGKRRKGSAPRWVLSNGSGATMDASETIAGTELLVALDLDGDRREARIRHGVEVQENELRTTFPRSFRTTESCEWDPRTAKVVAERREYLFSLLISAQNWNDPPQEAVAAALLDGLRATGLSALNLSEKVQRFRRRMSFARSVDGSLPDLSDAALLACAERWFLPLAVGARSLGELVNRDWLSPIKGLLSWQETKALDSVAPASFLTPLGRSVPIDYTQDGPQVSVRLQELFGVVSHPNAAGQPIKLELLSPAGRQIQVTQDLPGFWVSSYADVRRDMRGRYPKHPWPENPAEALPTSRAKPRR